MRKDLGYVQNLARFRRASRRFETQAVRFDLEDRMLGAYFAYRIQRRWGIG